MTHNYFAAWHGKFQVKSRAAEQVLFTSSSGFCVVVSMKVKSVREAFHVQAGAVPKAPHLERVVVSDAGRGDDVEFYRQHGDEPCPWVRFLIDTLIDSEVWHSIDRVIHLVLLCSQAVCNGLRGG